MVYLILAVHQVIIRKAALMRIRKAPPRVQQRFAILLTELAEAGPYRADWPNYAPLAEGRYHCHIGYSWTACWTYHKKTVTIEV
jgi:hypothetical protein